MPLDGTPSSEPLGSGGALATFHRGAKEAWEVYLETFQHPLMALYGLGRVIFDIIMLWYWHPAIAVSATLSKLCVYVLPALLQFFTLETKWSRTLCNTVLNLARLYDFILNSYATMSAALFLAISYYLMSQLNLCSSDTWRRRLQVVAWIVGFEVLSQSLLWWPRPQPPAVCRQFGLCRGGMTFAADDSAILTAECELAVKGSGFVRFTCKSDDNGSTCNAEHLSSEVPLLASPSHRGVWSSVAGQLLENSNVTTVEIARHVISILPAISALQASASTSVTAASMITLAGAQALLDQFMEDRLMGRVIQDFVPILDTDRVAVAIAGLISRTSPHAAKGGRTLREIQRVIAALVGTSAEVLQGAWQGLMLRGFRINVWPIPTGSTLHAAATYSNDSIALRAGTYSGNAQAINPLGYCGIDDALGIGCYVNEANILGLWSRDTTRGRPGFGPNSSVLVHELGHLLEWLLSQRPVVAAFPELTQMMYDAGLAIDNSSTVASIVKDAYDVLSTCSRAAETHLFPTDYSTTNDMEFFAEMVTVVTNTCDRCRYHDLARLVAPPLPLACEASVERAFCKLRVVFEEWLTRGKTLTGTNPICHPNLPRWWNTWDQVVKAANHQCPGR